MNTGFDIEITESEESELCDWQLPLAFMKKRHTEEIVGSRTVSQTWRLKERMKTVSVALVLCLNVGVDPPDIVKTTPCARLECWIDPLALSPQKALEAIGGNLQKQYERWQPRARYKQSLDPTVEEVKKLCTSLRRNAKEERVLFHYNGHGVPKPTSNGEIWVFNKSYTQYIPLSIYDLQTWMGSPSIFVYDCSHAGIILESFKQFCIQREQEYELAQINRNHSGIHNNMPMPPPLKNCIQLAACSSTQLLPMNPELPADLFTSCLSTPIKIALKWFCNQKSSKLVPGVTLELIDKIPGRLNDRRTPLGELNWIFTAITDTIAWNVLPRELFQKLFRQDLLVASLFRNFLLAERIMRSYNCTPVSSPRLPPMYHHPMWQAWDLAVDHCLSQLSTTSTQADYKHSPFFAEQLTAFQVWLTLGDEKRNPPEQLPIVLQVLLSQVHRLRALDLLGRFLDLGPWAVSLALSVGIFPYVLKLLQSSARELRPLLVFIWAKILAVDSSCQSDLVRDNGHKYFLSVLADPYMPAEHRTMAAFVLAMIVHNYNNGQEACLQGNLIAICLDQLSDQHHLLRQWLALCLARIWTNFDAARWCGVRDSAHEKLYSLLNDPLPEVRAAAVLALGTFIGNCAERTDHANNIDHNVGLTLLSVQHDGSPIVRKELAVSLHEFVCQFESHFVLIAMQWIEGEQKRSQELQSPDGPPPDGDLGMRRGASSNSLRRVNTALPLSHSTSNLLNGPLSPLNSISSLGSHSNGGAGSADLPLPVPQTLYTPDKIRRVPSGSSLSSLWAPAYGNVYAQVWKSIILLASDPHPDVRDLAAKIIGAINLKASVTAKPQRVKESRRTFSAPSSPTNRQLGPGYLDDSPPNDKLHIPHEIARPVALRPGEQPHPSRPQNPPPIGAQFLHSHQFPRSRKMFGKGPSVTYEDSDEVLSTKRLTIDTEFPQWSSKYFAQSVMKMPEEIDPESVLHHKREFRFIRNARVRKEARELQLKARNRLDDQIFINKNQNVPLALKFHPYEPHMVVADREGICTWNWEQGAKLNYFLNGNVKPTRITSIDFMNGHDIGLLLTGSDDGAVRIWRNYSIDRKLELVTSLQALTDMLPSTRGSGLVIDWEQESGMLLIHHVCPNPVPDASDIIMTAQEGWGE
uniref:Regulatory-associated protein of mTOR n=1 Tax=Saccoglossus kowalevskii TaxID=10224 RepID=A0ABM0MXG0_SACKO|nr:PREDICTED: regulatory-associated protein of mTOR [Saccoglossus kowalevskii]